MSGYRRHLRVGVAVHALVVSLLAVGFTTGLVSGGVLLAGVVSFPWTLVGAVIPDVDHQDAKAFQCLQQRGAAVLAGSWFLGAIRFHVVLISAIESLPTGLDAGFVTGMLTIAVAGGLYRGWPQLVAVIRPTHRTITHRVIAGVVTSGIPVAFGGYLGVIADVPVAYSRVGAAMFGIAYLEGFLSHLYEDGVLLQWTAD